MTLSLSSLAELASKNLCATHGEQVFVAMHEGTASLCCRKCEGPAHGLIMKTSYTKAYKTGQSVPAAVRSHLERRHGRWEMPETTAIELKPVSQSDIARAKEYMGGAIEGFGQLKPSDLNLAAQLHAAGFQPFHFNVIHGKLYMNMDGRTYWAQRAMGASYGGITIEPISKDQRELYGLEPDEIGVIATFWKVVGVNRFPVAQDIGRAGGRRDASQAVAKSNKAEMAIKRATVRVLRTATPLGVDIGTFVQELGEVVEGEFKEVKDEQPAPADPATGELPPVTEADDLPWDAAPVAPEPPKLEPRDIPPGAGALTHPFVAKLQMDMASAGLWGKVKISYLTYGDKKGDAALMQMCRDGHPAEAIIEAVKRAQPVAGA